MRFNSPEFYLLFGTVFVAFFALPVRFRNPLLLAASALFYMGWRPEYLLLILFSVSVDYASALGMARTRPGPVRVLLLVLSLVSNLGLLLFFKYASFLADSLRQALGFLGSRVEIPAVEVLLPVGISFYTFQALSYTVDVYRGTTPPERSFPRLLLYVLFFPQLIAGPIERSNHLLPQFSRAFEFDYARVAGGFRRVLWGLVKKVAIADRLAVLVDPVFTRPEEYSGLSLLLAAYGFAFQIYADFSAYSDIAIGSARVLGFEIMENFDRPYLARSIQEFWARWHISLSTWFRDYLYIPLGGNRAGRARRYVNLLFTFLVSGLWHGANWTFVAWGAYHGILALLSAVRRDLERRGGLRLGPPTPDWLRTLVTFHLVLVGWVLFRARSIGDAFSILARIPGDFAVDGLSWVQVVESVPLLAAVFLLVLVDLLQGKKGSVDALLSRWPVAGRWTAYLAGALLLLNLGMENPIPFIYFQF